MKVEDRLTDLLCAWDEACEQGRPPEIEELCRDQPDLVEPFRKLLAGMAHLGRALESTAGVEVTPGPPSVASKTILPMTLGRFRLTRVLGRGGLGDVFGAEDGELAREVAVKRIRGNAAGVSEYRRRFAYEAQITSALDHPGVVPVYGYGEDEQGTPYYAMRLIRGRSLDELIADFHAAEPSPGSTRPTRDAGERSRDFRKLLRGFIGLCETIAYAHSRGILHRDIKPQNVMIGTYGETLVVDWGLAKQVSDMPGALEKIGDAPTTIRPLPHGGQSQTQGTIGTPEYMSPEQWFGEPSTASDVFSLGATLWKLLVGKSRLAEKRRSEIERLVAMGYCPPPGEMNPSVPPPLAAICQKAMAADLAERYASADAMAADVELWLADQPVSVYPEPWSQRAQRWVARRVPQIAVGATLLATATLVLLGVTVFTQTHSAAQNKMIEELQQKIERLEAMPPAPGAGRRP